MLIKRSPAFSKDFFTTRRPVRFDISSVSLHSDLFVLAARGLRRSCQPSAPINLRSSIMSDTMAAGVTGEKLDGVDVVQTANRSGKGFSALVRACLPRL